MVGALIPRILDGQSGARAAHGIVAHGEVAATRVTGGVPSGREAVLEAVWGNVVLSGSVDFPNPQVAAPAFGVPITFESQLGYALRSVTVVDGGDYDTAPALLVVNAGQTYFAARLTANVANGTITSVSVNAGGEYSRSSGRVIAEAPRRTHYADVDVLGNGGRRYTLRNCAAVIPVRVGDSVSLAAINGDPRLGVYISGRQVPARPLIFQVAVDPAPLRINATRFLIGSRVPYRYLGWRQAFTFDASANVSVAWSNADWDADAPTPAALDLEVVLQTTDGGSWQNLKSLGKFTSRGDLGAGGGGHWRWSGVYQLDDGVDPLHGALSEGQPAAFAFFVDAGMHQVKWARLLSRWMASQRALVSLAPASDDFWGVVASDIDNYWQATSPTGITVGPEYQLQVVELGSGTY